MKQTISITEYKLNNMTVIRVNGEIVYKGTDNLKALEVYNEMHLNDNYTVECDSLTFN